MSTFVTASLRIVKKIFSLIWEQQPLRGESVDDTGIAQQHQVQPPASPLPACGDANFLANLLESVALLVRSAVRAQEFGGKWAGPNPGLIGLHNADDAFDRGRRDAQASAGAASRGIGGRDERVGACTSARKV
jgi:hypothetical protein